MLEQPVAGNTHDDDGFCKYTALSFKLTKVFFLRHHVRSLPKQEKAQIKKARCMKLHKQAAFVCFENIDENLEKKFYLCLNII